MGFYPLILHDFSLFRLSEFGSMRAIFLLGFEVVKETKQQQLERIRLAWASWKVKLEEERNQRKILLQKTKRVVFENSPEMALARGGHRGHIRQVLRGFWESWDSFQTDERRLEELIKLADRFKARIRPKKLRKVRKRYERHRRDLLTIPECKCGTCDRPARVRHHIIPLCVGGINSPLNLILICHWCHEKIHPWMKGQ